MKMAKLHRLIIGGLMSSFVGFTILSWWLFFREERAIDGIVKFYPYLEPALRGGRQILLHYGLNIIPTLVFAGLAVIAFGLYIASLRLKISLRTSLILSIIFSTVIFISYPILSTDIFSYAFTDRVATVHHQNTWLVTPDTFKGDPFESLADWRDQTKVYGLVEQIVYWPASYLGGNDLFLTVILYKLTAMVFYLVALGVFFKLTKTFSDDDDVRSTALRTVFWNPLFVLEMVGTAHNDIVMLAFLFLSLLWWKQKKWLLAGLALALSVQVKIISGVLFIFTVLQLLWQKQWRAAAEYIGSFSAFNLLAFVGMGISPWAFLLRVLHNNAVYWQSLPALSQRFAPGMAPLFGLALAAILVALILVAIKQKRDPLFMSALMLLVYLLFFAAAYWNWYVIWVLVWVPFIKSSWLKSVALLFSLTSLLAYPLLWISLRYQYHNPLWSISYYLMILAIPSLYAALLLMKVKNISLVK